MKLEEGKTYRRTEMSPSDFRAYVMELRKGDSREVWEGQLGNRAVVGDQFDRQLAADRWDEFTVLSLAPREPEWAGARMVIGKDGDVWVRTTDGYYVCTPGGIGYSDGITADSVERAQGPCRVLLDGRPGKPVVPVETLMHLNGVSVTDIRRATGSTNPAIAVIKGLGGWK